MKGRWILAGALGLAALGGAGMVAVTWAELDGGRWVFAAFAALLGVLAWAIVRPAKPREPTGTRFVPAWFFDGAILVLAILILLAIASCVFGRR
jgi:membrane-associated protease RseP (regulator of RpoE activity)